MFFPPKSNLALGNEAMVVCMGCKVREECRDFKKATGTSHGIWAGQFSKRGE